MPNKHDKHKQPKYTTIVANAKFAVHVLDPKQDRRDNIRVTLHSDEGDSVFHHLRGYEAIRLIAALDQALEYGPPIPKT
jgi:hypothetical protein